MPRRILFQELFQKRCGSVKGIIQLQRQNVMAQCRFFASFRSETVGDDAGRAVLYGRCISSGARRSECTTSFLAVCIEKTNSKPFMQSILDVENDTQPYCGETDVCVLILSQMSNLLAHQVCYFSPK